MTHACDNIHAVQIAIEERLADCDTATMSTLIGRTSGGPRAAFADPSWHDDCLDLTANACAALHRSEPERTVAPPGAGDMALVFPETSEQCTDGTRPAYYYAPGSGSGAHRWVIFLNGSNVAGGADGESHGSAHMGVWAPQIWDHIFAHDRCKFSSLTVGAVTLSDAFSSWLHGNPVMLIDGYDGAITGAECGTPEPSCPQ